jgi:hypothetical protein
MKKITWLPGALVSLLALTSCNLTRPTGTATLLPVQPASPAAATQEIAASPTLLPATSTPIPTVNLPLPSPSTSTPTLTPVPSVSPTPGLGAVSGTISGYPYGALPVLTFVAYNQANGSWWYWQDAAGVSSYGTDMFITAGPYLVVAYDPGGHAGGCGAANVIQVRAGQTATCDVSDWSGAYPAKHAGVP